MSLPVILIGDKRLTGFNPNAIDAALAASERGRGDDRHG